MIIDGALSYPAAGCLKVTGGRAGGFSGNMTIELGPHPEVTGGGNVKAFAKSTDNGSNSADAGIQLALDEWCHVAVTFDGGGLV